MPSPEASVVTMLSRASNGNSFAGLGYSDVAFGRILLCALLLLLPSMVAAQTDQDEEKIKVNTGLVELTVTVHSLRPETVPQELKQSEFEVFDNGEKRNIEYFGATNRPFDLILLLDISGSTSDKLDLLRKSAAGFIQAARPNDRIGVVTFSREAKVISPLTEDRKSLLDNLKKIKKPGAKDQGTNFWDALDLVLKAQFPAEGPERKRAVIVMTDGVDNALPDVQGDGSTVSFENLVDSVRRSDAIVVPIYLDTEAAEVMFRQTPASAYDLARKSLVILANESGGIAYRAEALEKLASVFDVVVRDLGTVYTLGYQTPGESKSGEWRKIQVRIVDHPELAARTKTGYYVK